MENGYKFKCETCRNPIAKAGKNSTGKQRYYPAGHFTEKQIGAGILPRNFCDCYELPRTIKEPGFVICDGNFGIIKAARRLWKNARIQRCLVHIARDAERKLGKRSPLEMNHAFRRHIKKLHCVDTIRKSEIWLDKFDELYNRHKEFIFGVLYGAQCYEEKYAVFAS
jgi:hypothetical protein